MKTSWDHTLRVCSAWHIGGVRTEDFPSNRLLVQMTSHER